MIVVSVSIVVEDTLVYKANIHNSVLNNNSYL